MPTYTQIGSAVSVGVLGVTEIAFTAIPATFTDLVLKLSLRTNRALTNTDAAYITFNGVGGTSYSMRLINGNGSSATSLSDSAAALIYNYRAATATTATSNTFSNFEVYIPNYAGSANKSLSLDYATENNATDASSGLLAGLFSNTSAITSIKFVPESGNSYIQYSTAYLYGVSNA